MKVNFQTVSRAAASAVFLLMSGAFLPGAVQADEACGELTNGIGPWDYRKADPGKLKLVESFHFSSATERLQSGTSSAHIGGDLDYTLRAFPNHHRALQTLSALAFKAKTDKPSGSRYTVECWFDRAMRMAPDDGAVHMLYGIHLLTKGDTKAAMERLKAAERFNPNDMNIHYNLGLALIRVGDIDGAVEHAKKAYALGHPLPGLRDKLKALGRSKDMASSQ